MKQITLRLKSGQKLKESIIKLVRDEEVKAGVIISAVGGLENANLRVPKFDDGRHVVKRMVGPFELVSCMGTLSPDGCHIHVSISDREGKCYGGHLKDDCSVFVTVELIILVFEDKMYHRIMDQDTGFKELSTEK